MKIAILVSAAALMVSIQLLASTGDCPSAVTSAALEHHAGATVSACKKENEHGKAQYDVKLLTKDGRKVELDISAAGEILLSEEPVSVDDLPQAVTAAFHAKYSGAKPTRAEKQTAADGKVTYEVAFALGAKKREATFAADGSFVEEE